MRGCELLKASLRVPGVECVAVSDLWEGRLTAAQETLKKQVATSRNYKEILDRKDIDAVIVSCTDHQHRRVVVDACAAGKDVYCEKPLSHTVDDGFAMIAAAQKNNRILQVGSQRVSSILYEKAREIYASGKLGEVCCIEAYWDRNSASGAWVYPIPPGVNDQNLDWTAFLNGAPSIPFDPVRFFRWRCFTDYGEGLGGDLFVHLISGIMFITGTNTAPTRAQTTGGLYRWKDGRQFPDLIETYYDYPNFRVAVRCNLNNDGGEFIGFYGTEGTMIIKDSTLTFSPQNTLPEMEGYSTKGWPEVLRQAVRGGLGEGPSAACAVCLQAHRSRSRPMFRRRDTTIRSITRPTSSARCAAASRAWRTRSSAITQPSAAIWRITRTSTNVPQCGMPTRRRLPVSNFSGPATYFVSLQETALFCEAVSPRACEINTQCVHRRSPMLGLVSN